MKFSSTMAVFGVFSSDDDIMPSHLFPEGLTMDTKGYTGILQQVMTLWMDWVLVADDRPFMW